MKFSEYFKLNQNQAYLDFVDIMLDTDIEVFINPVSIKNLNSTWGHECASLLQNFFETIIKHIKNGNNSLAQRLLSSLNERNEFHLGFSSGLSKGHAFGLESAKSVWTALSMSKASTSGLLQDLEDTCLMIDGIGKDMISDAVCNIIRGPLIRYTQDMCVYYGIPTEPEIDSGPIWNPIKENWEHILLPLPMTKYGKIILIPKIIVRHSLPYNYSEYYRNYLLPVMQIEELNANSSLVEVLKNGEKRVTKKALIEKYGADKLSVVEQSLKRPHILEKYKNDKSKYPDPPLTHKQFSIIEDTELPNINNILDQIKILPTGKENAGDYENLIEKILSTIFYPSLCNPTKQHKIHEGRKRIDITYTNEAKNGFFHWISLHYACPFIFIECKNYGTDVGNPEIDQLSGRFSPSRGKVGILICRKIEDKQLLIKRCIDTAKDDRGFIIPLDDEDLIIIVNEYLKNTISQDFNLIRELFNRLVN